MNLIKHIEHQKQWSENTFGPGPRTQGVCDHIRKELKEIEVKPTDLFEWIEVVILALDGAWRAGYSPRQIVAAIQEKQRINESRNWPDWRTAEPGKAIEHIKTTGDLGHVLYIPADFTKDEIERQNKLAVMVCEHDLRVCRKCGSYEAELNTPCKSVYDFLAIERWKNDRTITVSIQDLAVYYCTVAAKTNGVSRIDAMKYVQLNWMQYVSAAEKTFEQHELDKAIEMVR